MSTWKSKALALLPELKARILSVRSRPALWAAVEREFYRAKGQGDDATVSRCLKYAIWTLHPTPQAKTIADVSQTAAELLYQHADSLHRWLDRHDFMLAQQGLKFHLGERKYAEFEARFLERTTGYPSRPRPKKGRQQSGHP